MPTPLSDLPALGSFADDYERAGITSAEDLASLSVDDILLLDIGGIGPERAASHHAACLAATKQGKPVEYKSKKATSAQSTSTKITHPAMDLLSEKLQRKIATYARLMEIEDPQAWIEHVADRCAMQGNLQHYFNRFAINLEYRVV